MVNYHGSGGCAADLERGPSRRVEADLVPAGEDLVFEQLPTGIQDCGRFEQVIGYQPGEALRVSAVAQVIDLDGEIDPLHPAQSRGVPVGDRILMPDERCQAPEPLLPDGEMPDDPVAAPSQQAARGDHQDQIADSNG